jgi:hypothetical protein
MTVASPNLVVALANDLFDFGAMSCSWPQVGMSLLSGLRRDRKKSCDGNHNLVESEEAIAQAEKHAVESGGRRRMGQKAIRALTLRGLKKRSRPAVRAAAPTGHALKTPRGGPYSVIEGPHRTDTVRAEVV